jgi:N-acetylglucosaminyl-diphospho-decaprenol L-rhamnosyltransferase
MTLSRICVIIVNYNAAELSIIAAQSVLSRSHGGHPVEVHLVDNASPDGGARTIERAAQEHGWGDRVTLYMEDTNHGFGRGNNLVLEALAIRADPPDFVFLLNPDAQLENEAIAVLANFLDTHPKAAVAGARISKPGNVPVTAAFRFPSVPSEFSAALNFGPVTRMLASRQVPLAPDLETTPVDWVAGAAVMARFDVLRKVGNFDPGFFLYYEEVELMHQIARAGWQTWYVAEAHVLHAEGASTQVKSGETKRRRKPAYWYASWQYYFLKTHGRTYAIAAGLSWITGAALNHVIARLRGKQPAAPLRFFGDFTAVAIRPLIGLKAVPYE